MSFFSSFARFYNNLLHRYKYPVQIVSGGALWFTGDIISQSIVNSDSNKEEKEKRNCRIDWNRVGTMTFYGMTVSAPIFAFWYTYLDRITNRIFAKTIVENASKLTTSINSSSTTRRTWKIIAFKMLADMFLFDPIYLSVFFTVNNIFERKNFTEIKEKLKAELAGTYLADIIVWSPIQILNFRFVPVLYQPLVVQSCNVGWNAYLSYVQHRPLFNNNNN